MSDIEIKVGGRAGSGKSAIGQLIAEHLKLHGFDATWSNDEHGPRDMHNLNRCLDSIRERGASIGVTEVYGQYKRGE